ncbi:DUF177 domain-containing protein [Geminicoccaceae bacterium 1502E]|nr:DUF177 domain-containing protein [Geminicoccaceae bacterium 1502E]
MVQNEFSRTFALDRLAAEGESFAIEANASERQALATRLELPALHELRAHGRIEFRGGRKVIAVTGRFEAVLDQVCVVTLEPFTNRTADAFERLFTTEPEEVAEELVLDAEGDMPEPLEGGLLDLGELAVEELAVGLDPHPRAPGAAAEGTAGLEEKDEGPFAALGRLKSRVN